MNYTKQELLDWIQHYEYEILMLKELLEISESISS